MMLRCLAWLAFFLVVTLVLPATAQTKLPPTQPPDKKEQPATKDKPAPPPTITPSQPPIERRAPALEYALALMVTLLVLVIVCMPSRKG